jgi:hypothetical protein
MLQLRAEVVNPLLNGRNANSDTRAGMGADGVANSGPLANRTGKLLGSSTGVRDYRTSAMLR